MRRFHGLLFASTSALGIVTAPPARAADVQPPPPIAPPPPMSPGAPGAPAGPGGTSEQQQVETTRRLDEAEQKDSGRNFELFWLDGQIGGSYIDMRQFASESLQVEKASAGGPMLSLGAGVRFVLLVLGARVRHHALSPFNMWQINGEAGLKIPVGSADILLGLHGGYSFVGRLDDAGAATSTSTPARTDAVSIRGWNGGLDLGFDYYLTPLLSVGAGVLADLLVLNRPPVDKPAGFASLPPEQQRAVESDPLYQRSGTSAGLQLAGGLRLGLHLGL